MANQRPKERRHDKILGYWIISCYRRYPEDDPRYSRHSNARELMSRFETVVRWNELRGFQFGRPTSRLLGAACANSWEIIMEPTEGLSDGLNHGNEIELYGQRLARVRREGLMLTPEQVSDKIRES
jgi:hypothetical protein